MLNIEKVIQLLGKSERDDDIKALFDELGVTQPLKRPRRGEDQVNIEIEDQPIELCFVPAESLPEQSTQLMEGELVLTTVFVELKPQNIGDDLSNILPFGLSMKLSRADARKKFGNPVWSSPMLNNDRWIIGGVKMLACFSDDESSIVQLAFSMNA